MTITLTLGWWLIPSLMTIAAFVLLWLGSRERGMFGGFLHGILAFALLIGACAATLSGWLA